MFLSKRFFSLQPLTTQWRYAFLLLAVAFPVAWLWNPLLGRVTDPAEYALAFVMSAFGLALGVYVLHFLGRVGLLLAPALGLILFIFSHITAVYNLEPGRSFIGAAMETTFEETSDYITLLLVLQGLGVVAAYTAFVRWTRKYFTRWNIILIACFFAHLLFAQSRIFTIDSSRDMRSASRWSMDYIADPIKYTFDFPFRNKRMVDGLYAVQDPSVYPVDWAKEDSLVIVLMVGESLRADHLGINGYERDTTPRLSKERLVNFRKMTSYAAWTRESVISILADRLPDRDEIKHGSFVKIFQKLGFNVTTYNANTKPNNSDYSFAILTEGSKRFYSPRPDINMLQPFKQELGNNPLELHIFSPYGSHFSYRDAYTRDEAVFLPDEYHRPIRHDEIDMLRNGYDNSVLHTDRFLAEIIALLRDKNALLLYVSDHGESLGEGGRFTHGDHNAPEQRHVPFFFWFSDNFRAAHPDRIAALETWVDEPVHHANIFHTILGVVGMESSVKNPDFDLTIPKPASETDSQH